VLTVPSLLGLDSYLAHRVMVSLVGTATVVCVGLLARAVAATAQAHRRGDRRRRPVLISADSAVMSETLLGLLVVLAALAAYRLSQLGQPPCSARSSAWQP